MADARYRFGVLERSGVILGLRVPQVLLLALGATAAISLLTAAPSGLGLAAAGVVAVVTAGAVFVPVGGRTLDQWIPVLAHWATNSAGGRVFVSRQPQIGHTVGIYEQPDLPATLPGISILTFPVRGSDREIGIVKDESTGTYTGVLAVRGRSFALLDGPDKSRRLATWAGVLAGLAREGGVVHRIQWIERTVPDPGDDIGNYLRANLALPLNAPSVRSYLQVVDEAGPVTREHEVLVALQVHAAKASRAIATAGGGDEGAAEVVRRELTSLSTRLLGADIAVEGALTPRLVARAFRSAFDPFNEANLARIGARDGAREGTSVANAGPMGAETHWSRYRSDGAWHATYWIAEYPRVDVDADFLAPLLLQGEQLRTVAVTMEPVPPMKAIRSVEAARTASLADDELRETHGFVATARRRREQEGLLQHENDLSKGHALFRFTGFITVTAPTEEDLEFACGEVEQVAGQSFLDLRRLNGEQDRAFTFTLPLCRGLG